MTGPSPGAWALRRMRLRGVWLLVVPFFLLAQPTPESLVVGGVLVVAGLVVRAWAAGVLDKGGGLTTWGPYAYTRNPLYLGSLVIGFGTALTGGHWLWPVAFLAFFLTVYVPTMRAEARTLAATHPAAYGAYAEAVPLFVPRLSVSTEKGDGGFAWTRYRRNREWEAALGALAAFGVLAWKAITP